MKFWDILLTGTVVAVAVWYLYRKFVVSKGCSCGSGCCSNKSGATLRSIEDENSIEGEKSSGCNRGCC